MTRLSLAALLLTASTAMADEAAVSFKTQIQPILDAQCVFCHVTGAENGGLNLGRRVARASLLAASTEAPMPRVTPGAAEQSYLIHKLRDTQLKAGGSGNRMPMNDPPRPLDDGQLTLFVRWIEAGAPDN
ncbi:hypothetical protein [Nevskia sp.]|uniref:hypothetical protein n=1 Tax=Nevskia sp. TaxID=1929292 RepID=UPI0025CF9DE2|nr:hypothetical protein [Nevskia sp.]